jgi:hypothetical protein
VATTTTKLGLTKPAVGETGWGASVNTNFDVLDGAVTAGRVYDVTKHGLVDDGTTNNATALQTLINTIPTTGNGRLATFLWPYVSAGKYIVSSQVTWGERSIRNIGVGASPYNNPPYCSAILAGADSFTMFAVDGGSTLQSNSPSFENLLFAANGHTSVVGLKVKNANRCHLKTVAFVNLLEGVELDEGAEDCAWHDWFGVHFYGCTTGVKSVKSNSWAWWGGELTNCGVGIDIVDGNQIQIGGIKISSPSTCGIRSSGSENILQAMIEMGTAAGPRTAVQINSTGTQADTGEGHKIVVGLHGGTSNLNNVGIDLTTGTSDNVFDIIFQTAFAAGKLIQDAGTANRRDGAPILGLAAARPTASQNNQGLLFFATDTDVLSVSDGSTWSNV